MKATTKWAGLEISVVSRDIGAVITQSGTPVKFADDYQKIIDTRWRPVGIVAVYPIEMSVNSAGGIYKLFDHNLGYIPAMDAPRQTDRLNPSPQSTPIGAAMFCVDDTSVYLIKYSTIGYNIKVKGNIVLYNYPINEPYDSDYKGNSLARVSKSDYGMQIEGNNTWGTSKLGTGDNLGFSVNTNVKDISIAKIGQISYVPVTTGENPLVVTYDIPYPPLIKISNKIITGRFRDAMNNVIEIPKETWSSISLADVGAFINAGTINQSIIYIGGLANVKENVISYVIYRDPSEIAE